MKQNCGLEGTGNVKIKNNCDLKPKEPIINDDSFKLALSVFTEMFYPKNDIGDMYINSENTDLHRLTNNLMIFNAPVLFYISRVGSVLTS